MDLLVNDLSIHGQFPDVAAFRDAISRMMIMRQVAQRYGYPVHCHRGLAAAQVTQNMIMPQAIGNLAKDQQRALMQWLTQSGPFWEDLRDHGADDYLECRGEIVTDSAVGEAAYCCLHGIARRLISLIPSDWQLSPVLVTWIIDAANQKSVNVINHWEVEELETALRAEPVPLNSWRQLGAMAVSRFTNLNFSATCFDPLQGSPFNSGAAQRLLVLLDVLDRFKGCFDGQGQRTNEGNRLYQDHFTGTRAWFSDSSETEKHDFQAELTFKHPAVNDQVLFCTWHGKVKTPQLRIHFSWPVRADEPLYIVYVGPKITKQ